MFISILSDFVFYTQRNQAGMDLEASSYWVVFIAPEGAIQAAGIESHQQYFNCRLCQLQKQFAWLDKPNVVIEFQAGSLQRKGW